MTLSKLWLNTPFLALPHIHERFVVFSTACTIPKKCKQNATETGWCISFDCEKQNRVNPINTLFNHGYLFNYQFNLYFFE